MKDEIRSFGQESLSDEFEKPARRILEVDLEKYQAYLDDAALSDEHKQEFLEALWSIVVSFVDLGFGVHPMQEVAGYVGSDEEVCGKLSAELDQTGEPDSDGKNSRSNNEKNEPSGLH